MISYFRLLMHTIARKPTSIGYLGMIGIDYRVISLRLSPEIAGDSICLSIEFGQLQEALLRIERNSTFGLPIIAIENSFQMIPEVSGKGIFSLIEGDWGFVDCLFKSVIPLRVSILRRNVEKGVHVKSCGGYVEDGLRLTPFNIDSAENPTTDAPDKRPLFFSSALIAYEDLISIPLYHSHGVGTYAGELQLSIALVDLSRAGLKICASGRIAPDIDEMLAAVSPVQVEEEVEKEEEVEISESLFDSSSSLLLPPPSYHSLIGEPAAEVFAEASVESISTAESRTSSEYSDDDSLDLDGIFPQRDEEHSLPINHRVSWSVSSFPKGMIWNKSSLIYKRGSRVLESSWNSVVTQNNVPVKRSSEALKPYTGSRHLLLNDTNARQGYEAAAAAGRISRGFIEGRGALMSVKKLAALNSMRVRGSGGELPSNKPSGRSSNRPFGSTAGMQRQQRHQQEPEEENNRNKQPHKREREGMKDAMNTAVAEEAKVTKGGPRVPRVPSFARATAASAGKQQQQQQQQQQQSIRASSGLRRAKTVVLLVERGPEKISSPTNHDLPVNQSQGQSQGRSQGQGGHKQSTRLTIISKKSVAVVAGDDHGSKRSESPPHTQRSSRYSSGSSGDDYDESAAAAAAAAASGAAGTASLGSSYLQHNNSGGTLINRSSDEVHQGRSRDSSDIHDHYHHNHNLQQEEVETTLDETVEEDRDDEDRDDDRYRDGGDDGNKYERDGPPAAAAVGGVLLVSSTVRRGAIGGSATRANSNSRRGTANLQQHRHRNDSTSNRKAPANPRHKDSRRRSSSSTMKTPPQPKEPSRNSTPPPPNSGTILNFPNNYPNPTPPTNPLFMSPDGTVATSLTTPGPSGGAGKSNETSTVDDHSLSYSQSASADDYNHHRFFLRHTAGASVLLPPPPPPPTMMTTNLTEGAVTVIADRTATEDAQPPQQATADTVKTGETSKQTQQFSLMDGCNSIYMPPPIIIYHSSSSSASSSSEQSEEEEEEEAQKHAGDMGRSVRRGATSSSSSSSVVAAAAKHDYQNMRGGEQRASVPCSSKSQPRRKVEQWSAIGGGQLARRQLQSQAPAVSSKRTSVPESRAGGYNREDQKVAARLLSDAGSTTVRTGTGTSRTATGVSLRRVRRDHEPVSRPSTGRARR